MGLLPIRSRIQTLLRDEKGNFTLESSLVFPLIILVIVVMMLAAVYMYQVIFLQYVSISAAERASYIWDDHDRALSTGSKLSEFQYGVYESDMLLQLITKVIPIAQKNEARSLYFSSSERYEALMTQSLVDDKLNLLKEYASNLPIRMNGSIDYSTASLLPRIEIQLKQQISPLFFQHYMLLPSPSYKVNRSLVQPIGLIRDTDFVIFLSEKIKNMTNSEQAEWKQKGGKAIQSFSP